MLLCRVQWPVLVCLLHVVRCKVAKFTMVASSTLYRSLVSMAYYHNIYTVGRVLIA